MKFRYLAALVLAIMTLVLGPFVPSVLAQSPEPTSFKNVVLWVYPEYDDPRLLVMLEGEIGGATPPATVRFLVPSTAEMYSAGSKDATGEYTGGPPDRQASSIQGWDEISYELQPDAATFRVEYYDSSIIGQPDKTISYDFYTLYPIDSLRVVIQQPRKSTNFTVAPKASRTSTDDEGFPINLYTFTNVGTDEPLHFDIGYTRKATTPSISNDSGGASNLWPILLIIVGVFIVGGVGIWMLKSRNNSRATSRQVARSNQRKQGGTCFCTQCGQPLEGRGQFCTNCGNKITDAM